MVFDVFSKHVTHIGIKTPIQSIYSNGFEGATNNTGLVKSVPINQKPKVSFIYFTKMKIKHVLSGSCSIPFSINMSLISFFTLILLLLFSCFLLLHSFRYFWFSFISKHYFSIFYTIDMREIYLVWIELGPKWLHVHKISRMCYCYTSTWYVCLLRDMHIYEMVLQYTFFRECALICWFCHSIQRYWLLLAAATFETCQWFGSSQTEFFLFLFLCSRWNS